MKRALLSVLAIPALVSALGFVVPGDAKANYDRDDWRCRDRCHRFRHIDYGCRQRHYRDFDRYDRYDRFDRDGINRSVIVY